MKVLLFVDDYFSKKGVCYDVFFSKKILEKYTNIDIYVLHWAEKKDKKIFTIHGLNIFQQILKVKEILNTNKIDVVHIRGIGLMSKYHFIFYLGSILSKSKLIMSTFFQITNYSLNNKLFFEDPHVKNLTDNSVRKTKIKNRLLSYISPVFKKIYLRIFGAFFIKRSNAIIFFSEYEKKEALRYCVLPNITEIIEEPILNIECLEKKLLSSEGKNNFYKQNGFGGCINIVYWGRLDYEVKGIDRIIRVISSMSSITNLKIHLMGPDYNDGKNKIKSVLNKMSLTEIIIVHESDNWKGSLAPLIDADYSILASRADGFPRSLRESVSLNVPVICSIETNFNKIVQKFDCGFVFDSDKKLENIFVKLGEENIVQLKKNCSKAKKFLSEENIALKLELIYRKVCT